MATRPKVRRTATRSHEGSGRNQSRRGVWEGGGATPHKRAVQNRYAKPSLLWRAPIPLVLGRFLPGSLFVKAQFGWSTGVPVVHVDRRVPASNFAVAFSGGLGGIDSNTGHPWSVCRQGRWPPQNRFLPGTLVPTDQGFQPKHHHHTPPPFLLSNTPV